MAAAASRAAGRTAVAAASASSTSPAGVAAAAAAASATSTPASAVAAAETGGGPESSPVLRVLCLHGKHQDGEVFSQRVAALASKCRKANIDLCFASAPHQLPLRPGQTVAMRSWWCSDAPDGGAASLRESIAAICSQAASHFGADAAVDGLVGFSQGGAVVAQLLSGGLEERAQRMLAGVRFAVLAGAPCWPRPPEDRPDPLAGSLAVPSLHLIGERDTMVPPAWSLQLAARFADAEIEMHPQGHCFPMRGPQLRRVMDFILQHGGSGREPASVRVPATTSSCSSASSPTTNSVTEATERQREEAEAMLAIFPDELEQSSERPLTLTLRRSSATAQTSGAGPSECSVSFVLATPGYPEERGPLVEVRNLHCAVPGAPRRCEEALQRSLVTALEGCVQEQLGGEMVFALIGCLDEWLAADHTAELAGAMTAATATGMGGAGKSGSADGATESSAPRWEQTLLALVGQGVYGDKGGSCGLAGEAGAVEELPAEERALVDAATAEAAGWERTHRDHGRRTAEAAAAVGAAGGLWRYTVGLVGKPSAGKSTFFNAATAVETAKAAAVAAHPFTTIAPNIGTGFCGVDCPLDRNSGGWTAAAKQRGQPLAAPFGLSPDGRLRLVPIRVKDVAGLVPGAYAGRGRGNAFLNDLLDADVLVHVVDASGRTDAGGVEVGAGEGSRPAEDAAWVRREIHLWIFNNVAAKWTAVARRPDKLVAMFTGYHARPPVVEEALQRMAGAEGGGGGGGGAGCDPVTGLPRGLPALAEWRPAHLHRLVAHFLRVRFPLLQALNKCDVDGAAAHVAAAQAQAAADGDCAVPVCAGLGWELCRLRESESESESGGDAKLAKAAQARMAQVQAAAEAMRAAGCTGVPADWQTGGVLEAVNAAVALKPPISVFPVESFETLAAPGGGGGGGVGGAAGAAGASAGLGMCLLLRPRSTVEDLFEALKALKAVGGDFVRAEVRTETGEGRVVRKTAELGEGSVVHVMTNRRGGMGAAAGK